MLPTFAYSPNCYDNGVFERAADGVTCDCCGEQVQYYTGHAYCRGRPEVICPGCIADGRAANEFSAVFTADAEPVDNEAATDELFHRTPGYIAWQDELWLAHCGDYCEFLDYVGGKELAERGIGDDIFDDPSLEGFTPGVVKEYLHREGDLVGYLFRCRHCGRYRLYADAS